MIVGRSSPAARTPGPAASASTRRAAAWAKLALPMPSGRRSARHDAACAHARPSRIAATASSWPTITAAGPRRRRAGAAVTSSAPPLASISRTRSALPPPSTRNAASTCDDNRRGGRRSGRCRRCREPARAAALLGRSEQGPVREAVADAEGVDCAHRLDPEPAGTALIGERAVEKAVAQNPLPASSAGRIVFSTWSARAAANNKASARRPSALLAFKEQRADRLGARGCRRARG